MWIIVGYNWTLVDGCYLTMSKIAAHKWEDFLTSLGVLDFLAVRQKTHTFTHAELVRLAYYGYSAHFLLHSVQKKESTVFSTYPWQI